MASVTATPDPTTGTVLLAIEQTTLRDLFTRVAASSWGNATTGQAWTVVGGVAGNYAVNGTQGTHTLTTTNAARHSAVTPLATVDHAFFTQVTVAVAALTQPIQLAAMARYVDSSNYYFADISLAPTTGVVTLSIRKNVLGVLTMLSSIVLDQLHVAGATWNIGIAVCGNTITAKAWRSTVTEPGWLLSFNDFDLTTGTSVGVRSFLVTGNTNASPVMAFDNAYAYVSQPLRIYRQTANGVRTEVRGSPLNTSQPTAAADTAIATVWDNEAPLDTLVSYVLLSNCNTAITVSGSAVTLSGQGGGWLRDPETPSNNIRIAFSDLQFNDCDASLRVELLDWEPRVYRNASGVFDIVNAQRPSTVSMRRKRYESSMTFGSKTLDDVDNIEDIIAPGKILLLSLPTGYGFGRPYGSDYITLSDVSQDPIDTDNYLTPFRSWEVPFALSLAPVDINEGGTGSNGIGGGGATYADMTASAIGTSYATTTATGYTYQQLAQGVGY